MNTRTLCLLLAIGTSLPHGLSFQILAGSSGKTAPLCRAEACQPAVPLTLPSLHCGLLLLFSLALGGPEANAAVESPSAASTSISSSSSVVGAISTMTGSSASTVLLSDQSVLGLFGKTTKEVFGLIPEEEKQA